jgi:2-amino-4-hydroxy-6-hydroxymethyldihydropteridine diphosphokinase
MHAALEAVPDRSPTLVFIGLGGNVGDALSTLRTALHRLMTVPRSRVVAASRFYRTPAWGQENQPHFVNAAVAIETALSPRTLLNELLNIERDFGRERAVDGSGRWGPRTLDLDILLYGDCQMDEPGLCLPHPYLHERAFALVPLLDLVSDIDIPGRGSARRALMQVGGAGIESLVER